MEHTTLKDLLSAAELPWQVGAVLADCDIVHEHQLHDLEAKGHLLRSLRDAQLDEHHINKLRRALQQRDAPNASKVPEKKAALPNAPEVHVEEEVSLDPEAATAMDSFSAIIDESTDESAEEALRKAEGRPTPPPFGRAAAATAPATAVTLPAPPGRGVAGLASSASPSLSALSTSTSSSDGSLSSPSSDTKGTAGEETRGGCASCDEAGDPVEHSRQRRQRQRRQRRRRRR